jgi:hypothetical protein
MLWLVPVLLDEMDTFIGMLDDVIVILIMGVDFKMEGNVIEGMVDF